MGARFHFRAVIALRIVAILSLMALLFVPTKSSRAGSPGDLDPTFGSNGKVKGPSGYVRSITSNPADGSLYVAGCLLPCVTRGPYKLMIAKYNSGGTLDQTFGQSGRLLVENARGKAIKFQGGGLNKLLVAGEADGRFTLLRFNLDGSPDLGFGNNGRISHGTGEATALDLDPAGKILVAGKEDDDFLLIRLSADGIPDTAFGNGGRVKTDIDGGIDNATSIAIIGGRIHVGGFVGNPALYDDQVSAIVAFTSSGALDTAFGLLGKVTRSARRITALTEQQGKLVAAGQVAQGAVSSQEDKTWLARFNPNGFADTTFGLGGSAVGPTGSALSLLSFADGKLAATYGRTAFSESIETSHDAFTIARLLPDGSVDADFGEGGTVKTDFGEVTDEATSLLAQPATGKIVAAGHSGAFGGFQISLARYEKDLIPSQADLKLEVAGTPASVVEGGSIQYQATITNLGPDVAGHIVLTNIIASNVRFEGARTDSTTCTINGLEVQCALGTMAPGASMQVFIQVQSLSSGEIVNTARVTTSSMDNTVTNNSVVSRTVVDPAGGKWKPTAGMNRPFAGHSATLISGPRCLGAAAVRCGKVLVVKGTSAELFDPTSASWTPLPTPAGFDHKRMSTANLLKDGRVIVAGGLSIGADDSTDRTDIFDPQDGQWQAGPPMQRPRGGHATVGLSDGRILAAGGIGSEYDSVECTNRPDFLSADLTSSEIFDPLQNTWTLTTEPMKQPRAPTSGGASLTLLSDGRVLAVGGFRGEPFNGNQPDDCDDPYGAMAPPEVFNPSTGRWTPTGEMQITRTGHTATALPDDRVLVVAGVTTDVSVLATADSRVFNRDGVGANGAEGSWRATSPLSLGSSRHTSNLLQDGSVLVAGGRGTRVYGNTPDSDSTIFDRTEIYNRFTENWTSAGLMNIDRMEHTATLFPSGPRSLCGANCGRVLVAGGNTATGAAPLPQVETNSAELYTFKPRVTQIGPAEGPVTGGTEVTLSGFGLAGLTRVTFDGEPPILCGAKGSANCWVDEDLPDLKVHAISPPHLIPEKVHITLETDPGMVSTRTDADLFNYSAVLIPDIKTPDVVAPGAPEKTGVTLQFPAPPGSAGSAQAPANAARALLGPPGGFPPAGAPVPNPLPVQMPQAATGAQLGLALHSQSQASAVGALVPGENPKPAVRYTFSSLNASGVLSAWAGLLVLTGGFALYLMAGTRPRSRTQPAAAKCFADGGAGRRVAI